MKAKRTWAPGSATRSSFSSSMSSRLIRSSWSSCPEHLAYVGFLEDEPIVQRATQAQRP
jgi:hypothetical protein